MITTDLIDKSTISEAPYFHRAVILVSPINLQWLTKCLTIMGPKGSAYAFTKFFLLAGSLTSPLITLGRLKQDRAEHASLICSAETHTIFQAKNPPGKNHLTVSGRLISKHTLQKCGVNLLRKINWLRTGAKDEICAT